MSKHKRAEDKLHVHTFSKKKPIQSLGAGLQNSTAPQNPHVGTNAKNQYR